MIIIADKPGQLGNLLIVYANFLAYGREHGLAVRNPAFHAYSSYFGAGKTSGSAFWFSVMYYSARIAVRLKLNNRLVSAVALDWHESADLDTGENAGARSVFMFRQGWKYRGNNLLSRHDIYIKQIFAPAAVWQQKLDDYFEKEFHDESETIIGIHIRRGDYRTFEDGVYFYNNDQYRNVMQMLETVFNGRRLHFLICSNEVVDLTEFNSLKSAISVGPGHELLDLYALARCHYIAGPPSTYTMWASFYGNRPLYMIKDPSKPVEPADFKAELC